MSASQQRGPGLFGSVRRLMDTGLGLAQNRLELLVVEFQEEKTRFAELLMLICVLVAAGMVALLVATFTIVLIFWENGRLPALASMSLLYAGLTVWLWRIVRNRLYHAPKPFSATLGELEKDKACLNGN